MPDDNSAALYNTASQTAVAAAGIASTNAMNRKTMAFNREIMDTQRGWALDDWSRNNAYNTPAAQMERMRQAGLNPALMYGGSGSVTASQPVRGTEGASWHPQNPDYGGLQAAVASGVDQQTKAATLDNIRAQNTVIQNQASLLAAQTNSINGYRNPNLEASTANLGASRDLTTIVTALKNATFGTDLQYREQQLKKLVADTDFTINQDARNAVTTNQSLRESVARTLNLNYERTQASPVRVDLMKQALSNSQTQGQLMELEKNLKQIGIYPGDPWYTRVAAQAASAIKKKIDANPDAPAKFFKGLSSGMTPANIMPYQF